jgi:hypothetical protein
MAQVRGFHTNGYGDATHQNAAAAAMVAHADIANATVEWNVPELNYVFWGLFSEESYAGDDNDFIMLGAHLLLEQGYIMIAPHP